ncbi:MAG: nucleotidyltransferase [Flavobacteriaceae bacterium]|nr:nucleotidyltransferase [Flavobacteriaceae bacterium]MCY4216990.1 nucleotidyltransferase [Flavobacteriaceae bacterium]MCY4268116.1 nucleotidyltransferase [Flavobacteriaceae bacterium]MCY4299476.1 nucleotidyltransferase [Flavobacteriaceae bacterium]
MLSQKEQDIVIEVMKPFKPTKIGFTDFDTEPNEIGLLYDFGETPGLIQLMGVIQELEEKLNKKIDLTSFKYIHPYIKNDLLKDATIFFDETKREKANSI